MVTGDGIPGTCTAGARDDHRQTPAVVCQRETQRTLFNSARATATVCPPAKVNGVRPSNDAWLCAAL